MPSTEIVLRVDDTLLELRSELRSRCAARSASQHPSGGASAAVSVAEGETRLPAAHTVEIFDVGHRDEVVVVALILPDVAVSQLAEKHMFTQYCLAVSAAIGTTTKFLLVMQSNGNKRKSDAVLEAIDEAVIRVPSLKLLRQSTSSTDTAVFIISVADYFARCADKKHKKHLFTACKKKSTNDPRRAYVDMLAEIPGITEKAAISILPVYPTMNSLCSAIAVGDAMTGLSNQVEFGTSRKLGTATTEILRSALTQKYEVRRGNVAVDDDDDGGGGRDACSDDGDDTDSFF